YVHMPWCVKKCPYCDFNSHGLRSAAPPYAEYIDHLLADLDADRADFDAALQDRPVSSSFFGGGTPSLFSPELIARLRDGVRERLPLQADAEITLETNPGTVEHGRFDGYLAAGINRISFGVQSFDDDQLTLEPNTAFAANPPPLPDDDHAWAMQEACEAKLADAGYGQYEISAYAQPGRRCVHNLNYWQFGDYLGIGAGAHAKLSDATGGQVHRRWKTRGPSAYMESNGGPARIGGDNVVGPAELPFEYMLNALRLIDGVPLADFTLRTGLPLENIAAALADARRRGWLREDPQRLHTTTLGQRFLNDVISGFLG